MTIVGWEAKEYEGIWANGSELNSERARTPTCCACLRRRGETVESRHLPFPERLSTAQNICENLQSLILGESQQSLMN